MKKFYFILFLFLSINSYSQLSKTHYIPPLSNADELIPKFQYMYISTPSATDISFKITNIGGTTIQGKVSHNKPYVMNIGSDSGSQLMIKQSNVSKVINNKGFIVEADGLIYASVRVLDFNEVHAGSVVSKGLAALGTQFRIGAFNNKNITPTKNYHYTFACILATENNTTVSFGDIKQGVTLVNNATAGNFPAQITLNRGESYAIAVNGPNPFNSDGLIGASITSDKPIAVNCGSIGGTNGDANNLDFGFDQIVPAERTGKEYIFVKGNGVDVTEVALIIANEDNTLINVNGSSTPITLNAGKYLTLNGSQFSSHGNLYVTGSKPFFAYQGLGGTASQANQNMHFVPPISCETPKIIDNIPLINEVGTNKNFIATANLVTEKGANLTFIINGINYTLGTLPAGITAKGPLSVSGNTQFDTYTISGLKGNVSALSSKQLYLSYFGSSDNATYGGYYSGFAYKPEVDFGNTDGSTSTCLSNAKLSVSEFSSFEEFQWYLNGDPISGATQSSFLPSAAGFYNVVGNMKGCNITRTSDMVPVSICMEDRDNDGVNDYMDIDEDNDGITNCNESMGTADLDITEDSGTISKEGYSNNYNRTIDIKGNQNSLALGGSDGSIISEVFKGSGNSLTQTFNFTKPISLTLEYIQSAGKSFLLTSEGDFVLEVPPSNTILLLNPGDQLLIDTNYDGIYESGVTEFSSFQIRFRLKDPTKPLDAGTGIFKFMMHLVSSFSFTHKNLSDTKNNNAIFKLGVNCLSKDSDGDGISDEIDLDDDNDGIPTLIEVLGKKYSPVPFVDANKNGMNDVNEPGLGTLDSDNDTVVDYLDLDSDNDGISDLTESGHTAADSNNDGIIDGNGASFGTNGLFDTLETSADSGLIKYTLASTDSDGLQNYIDTDSDGDGCTDVAEAGFSDPDGDGYLGQKPLTVDSNGKVTSGNGYTTLSNNNYIVSAPLDISTQPADQLTHPTKAASFTISSTADNYQWQVATDGITYVDITDNATYSGSKTTTLQISNATLDMNGYKYQVVLKRTGNSCGLISSPALLKVMEMSLINFSKCDDDSDGIVIFNLKEKENQITTTPNQTISYFSSADGALNKTSNSKIINPQAYSNSNGNTVYARVENTDGTYTLSQINLIVSATQIPAGTFWKLKACDDQTDSSDGKDGIASFDFKSVTDEIIASLPGSPTYSVKYYKTQQDAVSGNDDAGNSLEITNINDYRNIGYPGSQTIWVEISSNIENACVGLGPYLQLTVNPLPDIELNGTDAICAGKNDSIVIDAHLLSGLKSDYDYQWSQDNQVILAATDYSLPATTAGTYTCLVKDQKTGCENTRNIIVAASKAAIITNVEITDMSTDNTIAVTVSGVGDFGYSIDNESGPFQESPIFENVAPGFHVVYANDKNGCGTASKDIAVVGAPPYFTPNGDGVNEKWKLKGVDSSHLKNSRVDIFDRFGKLVYVLQNADSDGWDGTFNGYPLPSSDYWFVAYLEDGREGKGHFALKR